MGTLVTVLAVTGPNGATDSRVRREPLTIDTLLRAGVAMINETPDDKGWVILSLRAIP